MSDLSFNPFGGELGLVSVLTAASLLAVWVPLYRALRICLQARAATRSVPGASLKKSLQRSSGVGREPLAVLMFRVLTRSLNDGGAEGYPSDFVVDASRQYIVNEYESHYARIISMYANLLPPIGFIGTTGGMLILFLSIHLADVSLELGALALALTSSIFALIGFALLEGLKIRLYGRLLRCLDEVVDLQRRAESAA
jgi:hypothetical protein